MSQALQARFDPSGQYIGAGKMDGTALIWDMTTKSSVRTLPGHAKAITSIEYVAVLVTYADEMDLKLLGFPQLVQEFKIHVDLFQGLERRGMGPLK